MRREKTFMAKDVYKNMDKPPGHRPIDFLTDRPYSEEYNKKDWKAIENMMQCIKPLRDMCFVVFSTSPDIAMFKEI